VANCVPRAAAALYRAFVAGDHARARRIQEAILPLATSIATSYGVAGLKVAMRFAGFRGGEVRSPLLPAPPSAVDELRALVERAQAAG